MKQINLKCTNCNYDNPYNKLINGCPICGETILEAKYNLDKLLNWSEKIKLRNTDLWRYHELLPIYNLDNIISLGEGFTPLIHSKKLGEKLGLKNLYFKDERQSPTASFKARQATVAISLLKEQGIKEVALASTGNVAMSYSAYAARADIKLYCFFPSLVPEEKIREAAVCGAEICKIDGNYDEAKAKAAEFAQNKGIYLDKGLKTFAGVESMKTMAFEIAEQLNWKAPDWYIQGVSGGMGPIGVTKGFQELQQLNLVQTIPALGLIQSAGCAPMVKAFTMDAMTATPIENPQTAIATLATGNPGKAYELLYQLIKQHGGAFAAVTDEEAYTTTRLLARLEGISVEPATAVAFSGLMKLAEQEIIKSDEIVVINCSGHTYPVEPFIIYGS